MNTDPEPATPTEPTPDPTVAKPEKPEDGTEAQQIEEAGEPFGDNFA